MISGEKEYTPKSANMFIKLKCWHIAIIYKYVLKLKTNFSTVSTKNERIQLGMVDLGTFCQFVCIYDTW